ncbi:neugrin [Alligator mississippiensis]|uniref:neugrin n=1 Tax=Alligator mississippiensis TaxID=8496 RepID=UPI0028772D18|nr:neugrin [Alligator mississippiensis]
MAVLLLRRALRAAGPGTRLLGRGAAAGPGGGEDEDEDELESLREAERALQRQRVAIRMQRLRREMEPRVVPERLLTWQAITQMRFLWRELRDEWPVSRLAEGFGVSEDAVRRVLRSKFSPSPRCRDKQDARALSRLCPAASPERGAPAPARALPPPPAPRSALPAPLGPAAPAPRHSPPHARPPRGRPATPPAAGCPRPEPEPEPAAEAWDAEEAWGAGRERGAQVVQRGRDFFDSRGTFLYRIPGDGPADTPEPEPEPGPGGADCSPCRK